jgi:hypothetical protein
MALKLSKTVGLSELRSNGWIGFDKISEFLKRKHSVPMSSVGLLYAYAFFDLATISRKLRDESFSESLPPGFRIVYVIRR